MDFYLSGDAAPQGRFKYRCTAGGVVNRKTRPVRHPLTALRGLSVFTQGEPTKDCFARL